MKITSIFSGILSVVLLSCNTTPPPKIPKTVITTIDSHPINEVVVINVDSADILLEETDMTDNIIRNRRFGNVNTGMPLIELRNLFSEGQIKDSFQLQESDTIPTVFIYDEAIDKVLFEMLPDDSLNAFVEQLLLYDTSYATIEGIGVGSTAKKMLGTGVVEKCLIDSNIMLVYLFDMPETAFVFDLPDDFVVPKDLNSIDLTILPDSARVKHIYSFTAFAD